MLYTMGLGGAIYISVYTAPLLTSQPFHVSAVNLIGLFFRACTPISPLPALLETGDHSYGEIMRSPPIRLSVMW